jgi:DNA invertase Pin-like site-specific DNA recombinase
MQLRELREYCERRSLQIVDEYVDKGISGSRERRPALDRLRAACGKRLVRSLGGQRNPTSRQAIAAAGVSGDD